MKWSMCAVCHDETKFQDGRHSIDFRENALNALNRWNWPILRKCWELTKISGDQ